MSINIKVRSGRSAAATVAIYAGYVGAGAIFLLPVLYMLWSAFRSSIQITSQPLSVLSPLSIENFVNVFRNFDFGLYMVNSLIVAGGSTLVGLALGVPAAYVVVRRGWMQIGFFMLIARMSPGVIFLVPLLSFSTLIGATDNIILNYGILVASHLIITLPFIIWMIIPFFESLPVSLEEAALIDGARLLHRFGTILLPLVAPGVAVATTLAFVYSWNYFLFALVLSNSRTLTLPVIAFSFMGQGHNDYGALMAASSLIFLPGLVLSIVAQRWLVAGITAGAVK